MGWAREGRIGRTGQVCTWRLEEGGENGKYIAGVHWGGSDGEEDRK